MVGRSADLVKDRSRCGSGVVVPDRLLYPVADETSQNDAQENGESTCGKAEEKTVITWHRCSTIEDLPVVLQMFQDPGEFVLQSSSAIDGNSY